MKFQAEPDYIKFLRLSKFLGNWRENISTPLFSKTANKIKDLDFFV